MEGQENQQPQGNNKALVIFLTIALVVMMICIAFLLVGKAIDSKDMKCNLALQNVSITCKQSLDALYAQCDQAIQQAYGTGYNQSIQDISNNFVCERK